MELSGKKDADVPVFVHGEAAWAEGVGECLTPVSQFAPLPEPYCLVVHPGGEVRTPGVFSHPKLTRNTPPITIRAFISGEPHIPRRNDLETVARKLNPEVASALDWLGRRPDVEEVRMTGSGACVFAMFEDQAAAERLAREVPAPWRAFVTRGRNRSVLHKVLDQAFP